MPRPRNIENWFKPPKDNSIPKTPIGAAGYDNPRENIDPHIKTKVVSTKEGSITKTPVNNTDIANKKYVDDSIAAIPADTDTLASVTARGNTTNETILIGTATDNGVDILQVNGWADFGNMTSGQAFEVGYDGSRAFLQGYNRVTSTRVDIAFGGDKVDFRAGNAQLGMQIDGTTNYVLFDTGISDSSFALSIDPTNRTLKKSGTSILNWNSASTITIGDGTAGVDYIIKFDGETNDGTITFMEDESRFDFNQNLLVEKSAQLGDSATDIHGINKTAVSNQMLSGQFDTTAGQYTGISLDINDNITAGGATLTQLGIDIDMNIANQISTTQFYVGNNVNISHNAGITGGAVALVGSKNTITTTNPTSAGATANLRGGDFTATGNLGTAGTSTSHVGMVCTSSGTANINYGVIATSSGATLNYGVLATGTTADILLTNAKIKAGSAGQVYTLPTTDGSNGKTLRTNGSGTLNWGRGTTTLSASGPTDNLNVTGKEIVFIDTSSNNVTLGGMTGGIAGQILFLVRTSTANTAKLEHNEGTGNQDIFLKSESDESSTVYGGWILVCNGTSWFDCTNKF